MPLPTGQILKDRYRIVKPLGQGGFGAVYRAWDTTLNVPCAVKENFEISAAGQKQFLTEARILANLRHPNLPRVTDYFVLPGQGQYLVMDYVQGDDLGTLLLANGAPLDLQKVLAWTEQVCQALEYLHSQAHPIIHRDIKPSNIKVTPQSQALLVDFGLAKLYDARLRTTQGARAITPGYSPQEQYGLGATDARSDIYALGATLYHLLTNTEPVESIHRTIGMPLPAPNSLNPHLPEQIARMILKAMEPVPADRYASIAEFRRDLEAAKTEIAHAASADPLKARLNHILPSQEGRIAPTTQVPYPAAPAISASSEPAESEVGPDREYIIAPAGKVISKSTQADFGSSQAILREMPSSRRRWIPVLAAIAGLLLLAGIAYGLAAILMPDDRIDEAAAISTALEPTPLNADSTLVSEETLPTSPGNPSPQPTLARRGPVLQGTQLSTSRMEISPQSILNLDHLGVVSLDNRKSALGWSNDSSLILTSNNIGVAAYNLVNLEVEKSLFAGSTIICIDQSPDENLLVGGSVLGEAVVWLVDDGSVLHRIKFTEYDLAFYSQDICYFQISPDGRVLYTADSLEPFIKVWDLSNGEQITSLDSADSITALSLSPDGQTLAAGTSGGDINLYDLLNRYQSRVLQRSHPGGIAGLTFSPDGQTVAYTFSDGYFEQARTEDFAIVTSRVLGLGGGDGLAFSPAGDLLAVGSDADLIGLFSPEDMSLLTSLQFRSMVIVPNTRMYVAFSPDGKYLAGTFKNYLYVWGIK